MTNTNKLKIIPLGGLEAIGMNITAFEYEDSIIVVDCGMAFPEDDMYGVDLCVPNVSYLKENIKKVKGFFITHGHEDHIGALPYVLHEINAPIYATRLTMAIIEHKLSEHELIDTTRRKVVTYGQRINIGAFGVEFIKTNHSIQDAAALAIFSPAGIVVATGDFKVDYTPVYGDAIDLQRFGELGKKGVLAVMCDSTNAERPGFTMSEKVVGKALESIIADHKKQRIIVATFASNVDRVQQIINIAYRHGRKVLLEGRSMVTIITIAQELGIVSMPEGTLIEEKDLSKYPDDKMVIISTGSQGEPLAALSRMAAGMHKKIKITPNDLIVLSSNPIPGNEKAVSKIINDLYAQSADVIFQDTHVSGHACQEEIKLIYSLLNPKYVIPIHGEYRHRKANARLAGELGFDKEHIILLSTGDILEIDGSGAKVTGRVESGTVLVDGLGVGDVGNVVLRDRQRLADDGIIIAVVAINPVTGQILAGPDIISRGFVYVKESGDLLEGMTDEVRHVLSELERGGVTDWTRIKSGVKDAISRFVWENTNRRPMILPIIEEVSA